MCQKSEIIVRGAYNNNLKNIDLNIPKNQFVVLTGVSGSGKSTIAFDILQRECQRQYIESMGLRVEHLSRPLVKSISGLSPSISVGQQNTTTNPRSTVGTLTELYSYLRLLYAKLGVFPCPHCAHLVHASLFNEEAGEELALELDEDAAVVEEDAFLRCSFCNKRVKPFSIGDFSFNKPEGACPECSGMGVSMDINLDEVIDESLSIAQGAIRYWGPGERQMYIKVIHRAARYYGFDFDENVEFRSLDKAAREFICFGVDSLKLRKWFAEKPPPQNIEYGRYIGAVPYIKRKLLQNQDENRYKEHTARYLVKRVCPLCNGTRLRARSTQVLLGEKSIAESSAFSLGELKSFIDGLEKTLNKEENLIFLSVKDTISERIERIINVGLDYLSLSQAAITLSPGESQRLRLASLLGSGLTGVLYIMDEPTVGLHPRDTEKIVAMIRRLRDIGNTVLVIEHDLDVIQAADYVIDIGPGGGKNGGQVVFCGTPRELSLEEKSVTGRYLTQGVYGKRSVREKREIEGHISIVGAKENNLKNITVEIPLGMLVVFTGVSGAGKSTLVFDVLSNEALSQVQHIHSPRAAFERITGLEHIDSVVIIDQASASRISRSTVATYAELFTAIRTLFAKIPLARERKYSAEFFSFNKPGGRCERCQGIGTLLVHMDFQEAVEIRCPACGGRRFRKELMEITYQGYSISDILSLTVEEAKEIFKEEQSVFSKLHLLTEVGVGYLKLGQTTSTLSGGEAQRIKLSKELARSKRGHTLYLLDEPTKGLHPSDVDRLMIMVNKLVDQENTVIIIEHNLSVVEQADYIIDLGPQGGDLGGRILASGTLKDIMECAGSFTGCQLNERRKKHG